MNKKFLVAVGMSLVASMAAFDASAWDVKDLLGGNGSNAVTNILEGVLTKTNISVSDMAGVWTIEGSAVSFKSENALAKAGGVAAAGVIESKLDPYYKQYGLTGGTITINSDGSFQMTVKKMNLSGIITKNNDGSFEFNFKAFGSISIGSLTTYVQQPPQKLEIMFDATKLKALVTTIANISGMNMAQTAAKLLDSYDGLCVGFELSKTGSVTNSNGNTSNGHGTLMNIFGGSGSSNQTNRDGKSNQGGGVNSTQPTQSTHPTQSSENNSGRGSSAVNSAVSGLFRILGGGK
ncbi:MAG: DUF4923 family protein [Muribaculum sp.]|nr:DUF4923 family protein [Muribaculum sp.]